VGQIHPMPDWKPRNTGRARELRTCATPAERLLWRYLARSQLGAKFSRQMPLGPYFADFLCRELRLVVEIDGFSHDLRPDHDAARDRWLHGEGYRVLRFTNAEVLGDAEAAAVAIGTAIKEMRE
jgi:very-short-patch-repair endonuclease